MKKCPYCIEEIKEEAIKCRYCKSDLPKQEKNDQVDEQESKQIIGLVLILFAAALFKFTGSPEFYKNEYFFRFLFCIALSIFGIGLRALIYIPWLKEKSGKVNKKSVILSYVHYFIMIIIISCVFYIGFYKTINDLPLPLFKFLGAILFTAMGLSVATIIEKFGL